MNLADVGWDDDLERISLAKGALVEVDDEVSRARLHSLLAAIDTLDLPKALDHLQAALEAAERAGDEGLAVLALVNRVEAEVVAGQMTPGLPERALALADATGGRLLPRVPHFESPGTALGSARHPRAGPRRWSRPANHGVPGFLELSLGNPAAAADYLRAGGSLSPQDPLARPARGSQTQRHRSPHLGGGAEPSAELLADLEDWSHIVDTPATRATAWRCRGLLCAAGGDSRWRPRGVGGGTGSVPAATDAVRTRPDTAGARRAARRTKQRRAAQESLGAALVGFQQLGARLWAEQARAQLAKLGGRRPQGTRLTPTEAQIASLVAQDRPGRTQPRREPARNPAGWPGRGPGRGCCGHARLDRHDPPTPAPGAVGS